MTAPAWLRDPLLAFVLVTGALVGVQMLGGDAPLRVGDPEHVRPPIVVDDDTLARLERRIEATFGRPATAPELAREVEAWLREELLVREAQRLGLDVADPTIRSHLASQMVFLVEAWESPPEPSEAALRAFYEAEAGRFTRAERVTLRQWQVDADAPNAVEAAAEAEAVLRAGGIPPAARVPAGGALLRARRIDALRERYGEAFADAAEHGAVGEVFRFDDDAGTRLLRVEARFEAEQIAFEDARDRVALRWQQQEIRRATDEAVARLRAETSIVGWPR